MALLRRGRAAGDLNQDKNFGYLPPSDIYVDTACQTLRPQAVIDAMQTYYHEYNACGGRVKYEWGRKVDDQIGQARQAVLKLAGKAGRDYVAAFTLNTTYGLNLLLGQLPEGKFRRIITSDIEHNSVFLPTMTAAKRLGVPRQVLERRPDGTIDYKPADLAGSVIVVNTTSNIDGRNLPNARQLVRDAHSQDGLVIIDGAQTMAHHPEALQDLDFDALCFSGHKMYGPSLGVIVAKKSLLELLDYKFIGGGTVEDVQKDSYSLLRDDPASRLEPGLQDFAGIIGLKAAIDWRAKFKPEGLPAAKQQQQLAEKLYAGVKDLPTVRLLNASPQPILSFATTKLDAHRLAVYLSAEGIMARSGYFCCHYFLHARHKLPPQLRLSIGLNNTHAQIDKVIETLNVIIRGK